MLLLASLLDNLNDDVGKDDNNALDSYTEKLDFADHEVFVKTDVNFGDSGFLGNNVGGFHDDGKEKVIPLKGKINFTAKLSNMSKDTSLNVISHNCFDEACT